MRSLVITVIATDRPGLVESMANIVADHKGSWVESRMSRLAGQFAGILRVSVPEQHVEALSAELKALSNSGVEVVVVHGADERVASEERLVELSLVGGDRPGIIRQISRVLAALGVNVDELHTSCVGAPWSGEALFKAKARLQVPSSLTLVDLRGALENVAGDLMVDIDLIESAPE